MTSMGPWTNQDRNALDWAMGVHGHSQGECADALREMGATGATQTSVSKWISGKIAKPRSSTVAAVRAYVAQAQASSPAGPEGQPTADDQAFAQTVSGLRSSREPVLGPRQADLVDALIARLRSGSPMSAEDEATSSALLRFLGIEDSDNQ